MLKCNGYFKYIVLEKISYNKSIIPLVGYVNRDINIIISCAL